MSSHTPIHTPPLSKFVTKKLRSWRSSYQRIFSLHSSYFITIDPADFKETNRYTYKDLMTVKIDSTNHDEFTLEIGKEKFKFKCKHRSLLLTQLMR